MQRLSVVQQWTTFFSLSHEDAAFDLRWREWWRRWHRCHIFCNVFWSYVEIRITVTKLPYFWSNAEIRIAVTKLQYFSANWQSCLHLPQQITLSKSCCKNHLIHNILALRGMLIIFVVIFLQGPIQQGHAKYFCFKTTDMMKNGTTLQKHDS